MGLFDRIPPVFRVSGFRRDRRGDVHDEIDFYIEMRTRELMGEGMSEEQAREVARVAFGDRVRIADETLRTGRSSGGVGEMMTGTMRDVRQAVRALLRRPGFTATILVTLALGIGGSTTMFTVVNSVLFRPLPYASPERLVQVWETSPRFPQRSFAPLNYLDARAGAPSIEHLAAYRERARNLLGSCGGPDGCGPPRRRGFPEPAR